MFDLPDLSEGQWSWVLSGSTLIVYVLAGRVKSRRAQYAAWFVSLASEPLFVWYGLTRLGGPAWGWVVQAAFFAAIAVWNIITLYRTVPEEINV